MNFLSVLFLLGSASLWVGDGSGWELTCEAFLTVKADAYAKTDRFLGKRSSCNTIYPKEFLFIRDKGKEQVHKRLGEEE